MFWVGNGANAGADMGAAGTDADRRRGDRDTEHPGACAPPGNGKSHSAASSASSEVKGAPPCHAMCHAARQIALEIMDLAFQPA